MTILIPLLLGLAAAPTQSTPAPPPSPADAQPGDWAPIPADELLVMELGGDRRVVIRLAPAYAPQHVANIRMLARAGWWDGESVYRVQENWVAQWGDPSERKPLPPGIVRVPAAEYEFARFAPVARLARGDARTRASGFTADGWPVATDGSVAWLPHCYGHVGVARDAAPDTGTGAALFTPIGGSARRLDRNYTVVGRVIEGMKYLSALPRSDAPLGIYATAAERTPIVRVRLASEMPPAERPAYDYRRPGTPSFAALIRLRENPVAPTVGTGGADLCEIPLAVRKPGG